MSRRSYVLTKGAAADLRGISRYTAETWGEVQRRAYVQQLQEAVSDVAEGRGVFSDWGAVLPGLRVKAVGSHYLFCLSRPDRPVLTAVDSRTNPASTAGTAQHDLDLVSG